MQASPSTDLRAALHDRLRWVPPYVLTWIIGKPYPGEVPPFRRTRADHLLSALIFLLGGVAASMALVRAGSWPALLALPLGWMFLVGGARRLQVSIIHECVHGRFFGNATLDRLLAEVISTMLMVQNFDAYRHDHLVKHHGRKMATTVDPDFSFLLALGFQPGITKAQLWRQLWRTIASPRFHRTFLEARLRANFLDASPARRLLSLAWTAVLLGVAAETHAWTELCIAWLLPLTVPYHVSSLLQFLSEHRWGTEPANGAPDKVHYASLSHARFLATAPPPRNLAPLHALVVWMRWTCCTVGHLVCRIACLVSDLPVHDFHHRQPRTWAWPNAIYERQADVERPATLPYVEVWGLGDAIDAVFDSISTAPAPHTTHVSTNPLGDDGDPTPTLGGQIMLGM